MAGHLWTNGGPEAFCSRCLITQVAATELGIANWCEGPDSVADRHYWPEEPDALDHYQTPHPTLSKNIDSGLDRRLSRQISLIDWEIKFKDKELTTPVYTFHAKVRLIEERKGKVYKSGVGDTAIFDHPSLGWWLHLNGSSEALYFGKEKPNFAKGDTVVVHIYKEPK